MAASFGSLDSALLLMIFELVDDSSPGASHALAVVDHHFHAIAQRVMHRRKELDFCRDKLPKTHRILESWISDPACRYLSSVRCIDVKEGFVRYKPSKSDEERNSESAAMANKWGPLVTVIENLTHLATLSFACNEHMPKVLLDALHKYHPKAKLNIKNWTRPSPAMGHEDEAEMALATSPCLSSIEAALWGQYAPDLRQAAFDRIVALAPNLQEVQLKKGMSGCVIRLFSETEHRLVETFKVNGTSKSLKSLALDGYFLTEAELSKWQGLTDMSQLERFEIIRCSMPASFFQNAGGMFGNLKHLKVVFDAYQSEPKVMDAFVEFLSACKPLISLDLQNLKGTVPLQIILRHGVTMQNLSLHEYESPDPDHQRTVTSHSDLVEIRRACPQLRSIAIDVDRTQGHARLEEIYRELAEFPRLHHVQLNVELGIGEDDEQRAAAMLSFFEGGEPTSAKEMDDPKFVRRFVENYVKRVWQIVHGQRKQSTRRTMDICVGEMNRGVGAGKPAHWVIFEHNAHFVLKVKPSERDDRPTDITIEWEPAREGDGF